MGDYGFMSATIGDVHRMIGESQQSYCQFCQERFDGSKPHGYGLCVPRALTADEVRAIVREELESTASPKPL